MSVKFINHLFQTANQISWKKHSKSRFLFTGIIFRERGIKWKKENQKSFLKVSLYFLIEIESNKSKHWKWYQQCGSITCNDVFLFVFDTALILDIFHICNSQVCRWFTVGKRWRINSIWNIYIYIYKVLARYQYFCFSAFWNIIFISPDNEKIPEKSYCKHHFISNQKLNFEY